MFCVYVSAISCGRVFLPKKPIPTQSIPLPSCIAVANAYLEAAASVLLIYHDPLYAAGGPRDRECAAQLAISCFALSSIVDGGLCGA
jgi:hypothetical protein